MQTLHSNGVLRFGLAETVVLALCKGITGGPLTPTDFVEATPVGGWLLCILGACKESDPCLVFFWYPRCPAFLLDDRSSWHKQAQTNEGGFFLPLNCKINTGFRPHGCSGVASAPS